MGHHVTCAEGFAEAFRLCEEQPSPSFDLMILGHSIPHEDKRAIIRRLTQTCPCPVLALTRINEQVVAEADRSVDPMDAETAADAHGFLPLFRGRIAEGDEPSGGACESGATRSFQI